MNKKSFLLLMLGVLICFLSSCQGCVSVSDIQNLLPENEFKSFEYHRSTSGWTKDIEAKNGAITNDTLLIESVTVKSTYPCISFDIKIEGYKQKLNKDNIVEINE